MNRLKVKDSCRRCLAQNGPAQPSLPHAAELPAGLLVANWQRMRWAGPQPPTTQNSTVGSPAVDIGHHDTVASWTWLVYRMTQS